jgi:hypothetical protein
VNLIIFRPKFDPATNYSYRWCDDIVTKAQDAGLTFVDIGENNATRENLEKAIQDCSGFAFYDHGSEKNLFSQNWEIAVDENNYGIFSGIPIYLLACSFGADGAQKTVDAGAPVIWAYRRPFGFFSHMEQYFKDQANIGLIHLLEGSDFSSARRAFVEHCEKLVKELDEQGQSQIADQILYNMESLVVPGNGTVTIFKDEKGETSVINVITSFLEEMKTLFEEMGAKTETLIRDLEKIEA